MPATRFAFLASPRTGRAGHAGHIATPRGTLPEKARHVGVRRMNTAPVSTASVHLGGLPVGHVVRPAIGAESLSGGSTVTREGLNEAVTHAARLGSAVVGVDAATARMTAGGVTLRGRTDVAVTNGMAYTAAILHDQVRDLLGRMSGARCAIVGATGGVGGTLAKLVVRGHDADALVLVSRDGRRLEALACNLSGRGLTVTSTTDPRAVRDGDLVVLLTEATGAGLEPEHLGAGVVVVDAAQPRDTAPDLARHRPDLTVVEGGIVSVPSLRIDGGDVGPAEGQAYASFAEAALLALSGHLPQDGHFSLGIPALDQVDHVRSLARAHASLGFTAVPPTSLARPVTMSGSRQPDLEAAVV